MISKVFKSRKPSCNFIFSDGTKADFLFGSYSTPDQKKATELMEEIQCIGKTASMHPELYVDENEVEIDSNAPTPIELLKASLYAQARTDIEKELLGKPADSKSDAGDFTVSVANTTTSAAVAAESTGASVAIGISGAKLANLTASLKK